MLETREATQRRQRALRGRQRFCGHV